jgi:drug/metabolite transporter (DMT)-like permease
MAANLLLLLAVSLAWAAGYLFVGAVDHGAPPITATAAMCLLAAAAMLPAVAFAPGRRLLQPLRRRPWVPVVMGLTAVALPNLAVVAAERSVTPAQAAVLGTTVPIATLLLGALLGSRAARPTRLTPLRVLGVAVALAGMVIFVGWNELAANVAEIEAILIMVAGGVVFALNGIFVGRQAEDLDSAALGAWTMAFAAPALVAAAFWLEEPGALEWTRPVIRALVAEGLVGLAFAYLVYYLLVARAGAWFASLYAFLVPPLGVLLALAVRGEPLTPGHAAGVAVVLTGLFLLSRPPAADPGRRRATGGPGAPGSGRGPGRPPE